MPDPALPPHGGDLRRLAREAGVAAGDLLDFSANINPLGPPDCLRPVIAATVSNLVHYPDPDSAGFVAAVAARYRLEPGQVIAGNGTTEILFALAAALPARRALIPSPAYGGYTEAAVAAGLEVVPLPLLKDSGFAVPWAALEEHLAAGDLVFLGHPNNPTGTLLDRDTLEAALRAHPEAVFVVDEAFVDFVGEEESVLAWVGEHGNLVVLRSMTKFYAVPGLRVGFAAAAGEMAARIRSRIPPWSVNALALAVGARVLSEDDYARRTRETVARERRFLTEALGGLPGVARIHEGRANFVLVELIPGGPDGPELAARLLRKGIAVRRCENFMGLGPGYLRLAVRGHEENERLIRAWARIVGAPAPRPRRPRTPALMFQGTCSDAGKSVMTAALCRILLQDGVRVAPFKAQNMSLNSFVTADGREMGRAQVVQAQACRLDPDWRMNPVLLKPSSDVGSQVIVEGRPVGNMSVEAYVRYKPEAFARATAAYDSLAAEVDAVVLEGAGSPAEVNLKSHDIVNMAMARHAGAPVILVGDIDRGGVFASFVGTMEVLSEWERARVAGFLVNRFRGREALLAPAFDTVRAHTGRPVIGVVPHVPDLGLPEEDSVAFKKGGFARPRPTEPHVEVVLIDLPHISNFTDVEPFLLEPDVHVRVVAEAAHVGTPDLVILPGSKNVLRDLFFLRKTGLDGVIAALAAAGTEIVGICGGFQILGRRLADPHGIEAGETAAGLGLLPIDTVLAPEKTLTRRTFTHLPSGCEVYGYEIHHGRTATSTEPLFADAAGPVPDVAAARGRVWGTYVHGVFDSDAFRHWLIERLRARRGLGPCNGPRGCYDLEPALDRLAAVVRERLDMDFIYRLLGL